MLRVVLDVNVLIGSALTPSGEARAILRQAKVGYNLFLSDFIFAKVEQVLHYPHIQAKYMHLTPTAIAGYLAYLHGLSAPVAEKTAVTASSDPEDNRILAAAVDGQADYLVTRNLSHFPSAYGSVKIISPAGFLALLRQSRQER